MNYKIYPIFLLLISLIGIYFGYRLDNYNENLDCSVSAINEYSSRDQECVNRYYVQVVISEPVSIMSIAFSVVSFLLIFVNKSIFFSWLKLGIVLLIISVFFIEKASEYCGGVFCPGTDIVSGFFAILLVSVSIIWILYKYFRSR